MKTCSFLLLLLLPLFSPAQKIDPVVWVFKYQNETQTEAELVLIATIQEKWHIYSQHQDGDGPIPTTFKFEPSEEFSLIDKVQEPNCEKVYSEVFASEVLMFSNQVVFRQKIKFKSKKPFTVNGQLEYMSCNDFSCLPPKTEKFSIQVIPK